MLGTAAPAQIAIELTDIVKRFPGVVANDGVNLTVRSGTVHAIVGENGSGKSTLMKTLYGAHRPDEGGIAVNGERHEFRSPRDAIDVGIGMVFQHFQLAANLTVWENIVLGDEPGTWWRTGAREAGERIRELGRRYGLTIDPNARVEDLGVGQKQRVEILKVLYRGARIIILDEPTAVLVPQEVDELFRSLAELTATGATAIFISHKLDEVLEHADAITVIRAGKTVGEIDDPSTVTAHDLAELMVGSELPSPATRSSTVTETVALTLKNLRVVDNGVVRLDDVSFTVHCGEVVGIAGVEGNGQSELVEAILGLESLAGGVIELFGDDITSASTHARRKAGMGYIPEDRQKDGVVLSFPLWENCVLGHQSEEPYGNGRWIDRAGAMRRTEEIIRAFDVRTPSASVPAMTLSGGNQQKLIVGREMTAEPTVLIASHPTRGIDVGAQAAIWEVIRSARDLGLGVVLISADLEELIGLSDTLHVMYEGRINATLDPANATPKLLGTYMTGANRGHDHG
ncbi:MAG TPA: ABC transporter ATP-binding protein [Ilumatobacter sp.]|nr:ABC transporter ATP-binding protein [Ilumatobacter sp.]